MRRGRCSRSSSGVGSTQVDPARRLGHTPRLARAIGWRYACAWAGSASGRGAVQRRARVAFELRQVALGVERAHAARAGRRDGLPVDVILDVADREHAGDVRLGRARLRDQVAVLVVVELVDEELRVRLVADRDEEAAAPRSRASRRSRRAAAGRRSRTCRRGSPRRRTASGARSSSFARARLTMICEARNSSRRLHERDLRAEARQEQRLLEGGVAAADRRRSASP